MWYFAKYRKITMKFNKQKNKMDLNNRKMTNHPPSPATSSTYCNILAISIRVYILMQVFCF